MFTLILYSLLPSIIYSFILWGNTPYKSINFSTSTKFLFAGFFSVFLLRMFQVAFSGFYTHFGIGYIGDPMLDTSFTEYFIQVGLVEEVCKWLCFFGLLKMMKPETQKPINIMYFAGVTAVGFSVIENFYYGSCMGDSCLALTRGLKSSIIHLTCGLTSGYWIAKYYSAKNSIRSYFGLFFEKYKSLKLASYSILAIGSAAYMHGLYDFSIVQQGSEAYPTIMLLMALYVLICFVASFDLINKK